MPAANQRLTDIHHIGLTVSDIEVSIRFYRDILGLTLIRRREVDAEYISQQTGYSGVRLSVASFKTKPDSPQSLEIAQYRNYCGERNNTATNCAGNTHLCFRTTHIRDVVEHLRGKGVRFRSEPVTITSGPNEGGVVIFLYDPDDYIIELFQPPA